MLKTLHAAEYPRPIVWNANVACLFNSNYVRGFLESFLYLDCSLSYYRLLNSLNSILPQVAVNLLYPWLLLIDYCILCKLFSSIKLKVMWKLYNILHHRLRKFFSSSHYYWHYCSLVISKYRYEKFQICYIRRKFLHFQNLWTSFLIICINLKTNIPVTIRLDYNKILYH